MKRKKRADRSIDGLVNLIGDASGEPKRVIGQVMAGKNIGVSHNRDLVATVQRVEAASAGLYEPLVCYKTCPKILILTIKELMDGAQVKMPPLATTFKQAERTAGRLEPAGPRSESNKPQLLSGSSARDYEVRRRRSECAVLCACTVRCDFASASEPV